MSGLATPEDAARWLTLHVAAEFLSTTASALRRRFERRARKVADGGIEAHVDGVRARKFGGRWRVQLGAARLSEAAVGARHAMTRGAGPQRAARPERIPA